MLHPSSNALSRVGRSGLVSDSDGKVNVIVLGTIQQASPSAFSMNCPAGWVAVDAGGIIFVENDRLFERVSRPAEIGHVGKHQLFRHEIAELIELAPKLRIRQRMNIDNLKSGTGEGAVKRKSKLRFIRK